MKLADVPGHAGLHVRLLTAGQFFALQRAAKGEDGTEAFTLGLVLAAACDVEGKPRWSSLEEVAGEPFVFVSQIAEAALEHNGLSEGDAPGEA